MNGDSTGARTSNKVSQQIERLRARRDVEDPSVNNGWRTANAPRAEVAAADTIERLRAALEGLHFHHKVFEPDCRHCQAACPDFPDFAPETESHPLPPLNDAMRHILGRPNFACAQLAGWLREKGHDIKKRAENEQAAVLHWTLGLYLKHGDQWLQAADAYLKPAESPSKAKDSPSTGDPS